MTRWQKISLFLLRLSLGWLMFYAGITKVLNPAWSAAGYLTGAKFMTGFFHWLTTPCILPVVNFLNAWGLTLLGVSLILGVAMRWSCILGIILMLLYYLPLGFPYPNAHALLVDEHIIYSISLFLLLIFRAGRIWGVGRWLRN